MTFKNRKFLVLALAITAVIGSYWGYLYFFTSTKPTISIHGIEEGGHYAGDLQWTLKGHDNYKVGAVSVWLDNNPVVENHVIGKRTFEYPVAIPTTNAPDGEHTLKILVKSASYRGLSTEKEFKFILDNTPLQLAFMRATPEHKVFQGRTLHVQFQANKSIKNASIKVLAEQYPCMQERPSATVYECFVPIRGDENPSETVFTITVNDHVGKSEKLEGKLQIVPFPFKKQNLILSESAREKFKKEIEIGKPENQLEIALERITKSSPQEKYWQGVFLPPCDMKEKSITTEFGTMRTTRERGIYRHDALDIMASPKSVVCASQAGIVALIDRYAHSGNTVVIDHGYGIITMYFHLENFASIKVGDRIKKGTPLGTLGMTGYASGYHLHWELRVNNVPVEPMEWTTIDF